MATLQMLASILESCNSPIWLTTNEKLVGILEYCLWDALRLGISQHCSGSAPCLAFDCDRLLMLTRRALGKNYLNDWEISSYDLYLGDRVYENLFHHTKVDAENVSITIMNDGADQKPVFRREHMIHAEVTGIYGSSASPYNADQRNWDGTASSAHKAKGRKRMSFAGRDIGRQYFSKLVCDEKIFVGSHSLPSIRPSCDMKLYPLDRENKTILG